MIEIHVSYTPLYPQSVILLTRMAGQDPVIGEAIGALRDAGYAHQVPVSMESHPDLDREIVYRWAVPLREAALTYEHLSGMASQLWEMLSPLPDYHVIFAGGHPDGWAQGFFDEMS